MRCTGEIHDLIDIDDPDYCYQVSEAVVTPTRMAIDWKEGGVQFFLRANSTNNGMTYKGNYGTPRPLAEWHIEFKRYDAHDNTILLLGTWWQEGDGSEGKCVYLLRPADTATKKRSRS